jgi:glycogen operon protein
VLIDSASDEPRPVACGEIELAPRSVVLLAGDRPVGHNRGASSETLRRLADKAGVQPVWWSIDGERHDVGEDTTRHLLGAMRLPAGSEAEARDSLELLDDLYERRPLPPVLVLREGEPLPFAHGTRLLVDSEAPTEHALARGRYTLVREDAPDAPCRLTVAPRRAWLPESVRSGARPWGVAAQLYSLRRDGDQGIGDFTTLRALGEHVSRAGAAAIGVNPLHALFGEQRERASPYSPSDRRFLDPIYLDLAALADLPGGAELEWVDDAAGALVDYSAVWALKERALRGLFARFEEWRASNPSAPLALALASFVERGGETLRTYAAFCAISRRRRGEPWQHWPAQLRDPHGEAARSFAAGEHEEIGFHAFLQWLCDRQLAAAAGGMKAAGMEIGLYRDLAIGAAPDGAEAWASQDLLASGVSIGAPPDPLGPAGQVWSLPPSDPHRLAASGYDGFAALLRANMAHAGALRIDHAIGLARLFWVPDGGQGSDGAYVTYPCRDLLGEVALASADARCLVVGEDLGTVPEGFRDALAASDMLGYRAMLLERDGIGFRDPATYPPLSLACVTSHDLPTFAGWWRGVDFAERVEVGQMDEAGVGAALAGREEEKAALADALGDGATPAAEAEDLTARVHGWVASSPAALVMVQADDLALEQRSVNLPGTDTERPNWRRRLKPTLGELFGPGGARIAAAVRAARADPPLR